MTFAGCSLNCYNCYSKRSWDDCTANQIEKTCSSSHVRCGIAEGHLYAEVKKYNLSVALHVYFKGCTTSAKCKDVVDGNDENCRSEIVVTNDSLIVSTCDFSCCDEDLCNESRVKMFSAITLMICALVALCVAQK